MVDIGPHHHRTASSPIRRAALVVAVACLVVGSCSDDDDDAIPDPSSSSTTLSSSTSTSSTTEPDEASSTTTAPDDVQALVTARYLEFWDARFEANTEPVDPDSARLRDLATGDQLTNVVAETQQRKDSGLALRAADAPVKERRVRLVDGRWRLAAAQELQKWEGVAGCALSSDS